MWYISHSGVQGMKWYHRYHQSYKTKPTHSGKIGIEHFSRDVDKSNKVYKSLNKKEKYYLTADKKSKEYSNYDEYNGDTNTLEYSDIATYKGDPIGFIDGWYDKSKRSLEIAVAVDKKHQGNRVASNLMDRMIKQTYKNEKVDRISYGVHRDNIASQKLAEKFGFVLYDAQKNDEWILYNKINDGTKNKSFLSYYNEDITNKNVKEYKQLKHVRVNKNTKGKIFIGPKSDYDLIGMVNTEKKNDGHIWIQGIELFGEAKGKGFSKDLLDYAVNDLHATHLSVNKNNKIAKHVYDKYGFKVYDETDSMYMMRLKRRRNYNG